MEIEERMIVAGGSHATCERELASIKKGLTVQFSYRKEYLMGYSIVFHKGSKRN